MINAVIVDDEPNNLIILASLIEEFCPNVAIKGKANDARKAETLIREIKPDMVFLDIEMPYGNGFDVVDKLRPVNFEVVFVTAFDEYTLRAFRYSALDYLLKPINIKELQECVRKAEQHMRLKNFDQRLDDFILSFKKLSLESPKIALPGKNGIVFVPANDIIRIEGNRGYSSIFIKNKSKVTSSKNIGEYEALLPPGKFYRAHHSHLVNLHCINGYQRGRGGFIEMEDGAVIEVAVRRKEELMVRLGLTKC